MKQSRVAFILAAGKSTRLGSKTSKILQILGGRPVLEYALDVAQHWATSSFVVVSPNFQPISWEPSAGYSIHYEVQAEALGTGDAFRCAFQKAFPGKNAGSSEPDILVLLGDACFMDPEDLRPMMEVWALEKPDILVMSMTPPNPHGYGRLNLQDGRVVDIVETQNATPEEKKLTLCNTGIFLMRACVARTCLEGLTPNADQQYFLTDFVKHAAQAGNRVSHREGPWESFVGLNTRQDLVQVEHLLQRRFRKRAIEQGALVYAPETVFFSYDTQVNPDVKIHPYVSFGPGVNLAKGTEVLSFCVLSGCITQENARIGPFAHVRGGTTLGHDSTIGNFVELKNAILGPFSKVKHLSYLGDVRAGCNVTFGASVITCNYDGHTKHTITIGEKTLIGCHTSLVAPITIGQNVTIGAGTTLVEDVPSEHLALSRSPQKTRLLSPTSKHRNRKTKDSACAALLD